jgi:nucleoside-diphosphate-sugar epimerase
MTKSSRRPWKGPVVVTGATGFVGANICRHFLARKAQVIGIEGPSMQRWRLPDDPSFRVVTVDLRDEGAVRRFLADAQPEVVINCAAYGAYSNQTNVPQVYEVNVNGVRHLLEGLRQVRGLRAFIQAGSSSEYGTNCAAPREDAPTWPDSHYAVSKVAAAATVRFYAAKYGVPGWVLRLYSIYGPFEDASRLIPKLLLECARGALPPLVSPDVSRDFVYVGDACHAFERLVVRAPRLNKGEIFNIGAGKMVTLRHLVQVARKAFRVPAQPSWGSMANRHWDHPRWYSNSAKARRALAWRATTSLERGLGETMRWISSNPELMEASQQFSVVRAAP